MRVVQFIDALDYGDGVSRDVINITGILDSLEIENRVYCKYVNEHVQKYVNHIDDFEYQNGDILIYHYSGYSSIAVHAMEFSGKKIMRYHNVTPGRFFANTQAALQEACDKGLKQLKKIKDNFDIFLADSDYNKSDLIHMGIDKNNVFVIPVVMDFYEMDSKKTVDDLTEKLRENTNILFVGRVVPNKCIEDVMNIFEHYFLYHNRNAKLYIVGNFHQDETYTQQINELRGSLISCDNIELTGKVPDEELVTYYKNSHIFLCMSEHEGFCIPLLEAQHFDVPVVAFNSTAIKGTLGNSGVLINEKNFAYIANLTDEIISNEGLKQVVLAAQRKNMGNYSLKNSQEKLEIILQKLGDLENV